jgi:citrate synthase
MPPSQPTALPAPASRRGRWCPAHFNWGKAAVCHTPTPVTTLAPCRYAIEELATEGDFIDSTFLLLHGDLPNKQEKQMFERELKYHTLVHEQLIQVGLAGCRRCWLHSE